MARRVFWNRRSGIDRRGMRGEIHYDRRMKDRRSEGGNDFVLVIGSSGIDRFTLLVTIPVMLVSASALFVKTAL